MTTDPHQASRQTRRNLIIFTMVTLSAGWLGAALDRVIGTPDPQQGLGILLWILLPTAIGLLLRAVGGDGWQDAGVNPRLVAGWRWYAVALLLFPLISLLLLGIGPRFGAFTLPSFVDQGVGAFLSLATLATLGAFGKNIFEEFAWRGYLTPRFAALNLPRLRNHLLTGLIWAGWHLPYWLFFVDVRTFSTLSLPTFIVLAMTTLVITAVTYGEVRLGSRSVWPAVVLHSVANGVTATFLLSGFVQLNGGLGLLFSPGNDGVVHSILFALVGLALYRYSRRTPSVLS